MIFMAVLLAGAFPDIEVASCHAAEVEVLDQQTYGEALPLYEKKTAIDTRLADLATKNPLGTGLRGVFDRNYDEKSLREQSDKLTVALGSILERYRLKKSMLAMKPCPPQAE